MDDSLQAFWAILALLGLTAAGLGSIIFYCGVSLLFEGLISGAGGEG